MMVVTKIFSIIEFIVGGAFILTGIWLVIGVAHIETLSVIQEQLSLALEAFGFGSTAILMGCIGLIALRIHRDIGKRTGGQ